VGAEVIETNLPDFIRETISNAKTPRTMRVSTTIQVGVAEDNLGKIFNPFFTTKAQGQGLGLAVCKRLVEA
jgi:C4-dicarboxylate-specific signal transduction histidine kinase